MSSMMKQSFQKSKSATFFNKRFVTALFFAFFLGIAFGAVKADTVLAVVKTYDKLEVFADVLSLVEQNYVEEVDSDKLIEGAINGMIRTLDPHSSFMTEQMYKEMQAETEGQFGGIGIEITIKDDVLTVVAPIEDTPAWKAGIQAGDRIVKVDGESTFDISIMEAVRKMRGKRGDPVTITIVREGMDKPMDVVIVRDIIHVTSVKSELLPGDWGYVRIRSFSKDVGADLDKRLKELAKQGSKGLVLDLRNDPGGLLNQAVAVAELFLNKGELIVYTRGRVPNQNMEFTAKRVNSHNDYPMVVLVNRGSASASEIVAGALQDLKRAVIVGSQSFGKGSVQTIIPLRGGAGLRLTTAKYYTPAGRQIQGIGITPDIVVSNAPDRAQAKADKIRKDENSVKKQLREKLEGVHNGNGGEVKGKKNGKPAKKSIVNLEKDIQLQRAIGVLKSWEIIRGIQSKNMTVSR